MNTTEYQDALISVSPTHVRIKNYYFPNGADKLVSVSDIDWIQTKRPSIRSGKWRLWGTGNLHTWFARDYSRPRRDTIFVMKLKEKWWQVGFTVEDSPRAREALDKLGVLKTG